MIIKNVITSNTNLTNILEINSEISIETEIDMDYAGIKCCLNSFILRIILKYWVLY